MYRFTDLPALPIYLLYFSTPLYPIRLAGRKQTMQTYTHYVMTAVWNRAQKGREARRQATTASEPSEQAAARRLPPPRPFWLMLGSVLPDLPLIAITVFYIIMDAVTGGRAVAESARRRVNPMWVISLTICFSMSLGCRRRTISFMRPL